MGILGKRNKLVPGLGDKTWIQFIVMTLGCILILGVLLSMKRDFKIQCLKGRQQLTL